VKLSRRLAAANEVFVEWTKSGGTEPKNNDEIARSDRTDQAIELRVAPANENIGSRDIVIGGEVTELDSIIGSAGA